MVVENELIIGRGKIRACLSLFLLILVVIILACISTESLNADPIDLDDNVLELGEKVHVVTDTRI